MQTSPRVYTPSHITALWSHASLPAGLLPQTLLALRDAFIVLDAAQGGRGVVDIQALRETLQANNALLWCSDSSSDDDDDYVGGAHDARRCRPATTLTDYYGLIAWWIQHVGEESGASRVGSPSASLARVHARHVHVNDERSTGCSSAAAGREATADVNREGRQPLRVLSPRAVNTTAGGPKGSLFALASFRSPSIPLTRQGHRSPPQLTSFVSPTAMAASAQPSPCSLSLISAETVATPTRTSLRPLKPLTDRRSLSSPALVHAAARRHTRHHRRGDVLTVPSRSHSRGSGARATLAGEGEVEPPTAPAANGFGFPPSPSPPPPRNEPSADAHTYATASTCASSSAPASHWAFAGREGTVWKVAARARDALHAFVARLAESDLEGRTDSPLTDADVTLLARAFSGFDGHEENRVDVAALSSALTALVHLDLSSPHTRLPCDEAGKRKLQEHITCAAAAMIARACGYDSELAEADAAPPPPPTSFTRSQFIASFLCQREAFPPRLLSVLLDRVIATTTTTPATTARTLSLCEASLAGADGAVTGKTEADTARATHETSPFEMSLLVELLLGYPLEVQRPPATSLPTTSADKSDEVKVEDVLEHVRQGGFATVFERSVPSDRQACEGLLKWLRELARRHASSTRSTSGAPHVHLPSLVDALVNASTAGAPLSGDMSLPPTRTRLERALETLAAMQWPHAMLRRLVELIVSLDLHRPHDDTCNGSTDAGGEETAAGAAVRQLERLRRLRRGIPRTLGLLESSSPSGWSSSSPPGGSLLLLETSLAFARLTELARAVVATAAPRLSCFTSIHGDSPRKDVVELSLEPFFRRVVQLVVCVPQYGPATAASRQLCVRRALHTTLCALGFGGAREVGATLLAAAQFVGVRMDGPVHDDVRAASPGRLVHRAVLPNLTDAVGEQDGGAATIPAPLSSTADATQRLCASLCAIAGRYRRDWSAAQSRAFIVQALIPTCSQSGEATGTMLVITDEVGGSWVDAGVLLSTWLSAVPLVHFPRSSAAPESGLASHAACSVPFPLCEEVALASPFADVTSLYLSLRQMTVEDAQGGRADTSSPAYRTVQPIPFSRLHELLSDAPVLFELLRRVSWQDEVTADFLFLSHTLKAVSLTPQGIYVKLSKLQRTLSPRRSPAPTATTTVSGGDQHDREHRHEDRQRRASATVTDMSLWPTPGHAPAAQECGMPEETESIVRAQAYNLAYPVADVLAAAHVFHLLLDASPPSMNTRSLSLHDAVSGSKPVQDRLAQYCRHGDSCWLHTKTSTTPGAIDKLWGELVQCIFCRRHASRLAPRRAALDEPAQSTQACTDASLASMQLSLPEWTHELLDLRVRATMEEERMGLQGLRTEVRPSQFIHSLLQHAKICLQ